jgi:predicted nucleotidyltransferase
VYNDLAIMVDLIEQHREQIVASCRKYRVKRLELFGSAARGDFDIDRSDVDFLYEFDPTDMLDLADRFFGLKDDLERLLQLQVDLISTPDITNPYFLQVANRHRQILYAA